MHYIPELSFDCQHLEITYKIIQPYYKPFHFIVSKMSRLPAANHKVVLILLPWLGPQGKNCMAATGCFVHLRLGIDQISTLGREWALAFLPIMFKEASISSKEFNALISTWKNIILKAHSKKSAVSQIENETALSFTNLRCHFQESRDQPSREQHRMTYDTPSYDQQAVLFSTNFSWICLRSPATKTYRNPPKKGLSVNKRAFFLNKMTIM